MPTYSKQSVSLYSRAPICLFGANVLMSQRRKAVLKGEDPKKQFRNDKTKSGEVSKNPQYDYLMVESNGVIYKFPISLTENNKAQQNLIDGQTSDGKFLPLKFSGLIIVSAALLEDGEPQTMKITVSSLNPQTGKVEKEEVAAPLFEAKVEGIFQLSIAATETTVNTLLGTKKAASVKTEEHEEAEAEEEAEELPKPRKAAKK